MEEEKTSLQEFSLAELATYDENNQKQYMCIDGKVIDISQYKFQHPGGLDILLEHAGTDASESFDNAGHTKEAREQLKTLAIGYVKDYTRQVPKKVSAGQKGSGLDALTFAFFIALIACAAYVLSKFLQAK